MTVAVLPLPPLQGFLTCPGADTPPTASPLPSDLAVYWKQAPAEGAVSTRRISVLRIYAALTHVLLLTSLPCPPRAPIFLFTACSPLPPPPPLLCVYSGVLLHCADVQHSCNTYRSPFSVLCLPKLLGIQSHTGSRHFLVLNTPFSNQINHSPQARSKDSHPSFLPPKPWLLHAEGAGEASQGHQASTCPAHIASLSISRLES